MRTTILLAVLWPALCGGLPGGAVPGAAQVVAEQPCPEGAATEAAVGENVRPFVQLDSRSVVVVNPAQDPGQGLEGFPYDPAHGYYYYRPWQILEAYGILSGSNGKGQTVALVEAYVSPHLPDDVDAFCRTFNLPDTSRFSLQIVRLGSPPPRDNWAVETALDVEWLHAVAPGVNIVVYEATGQRTDKIMDAVRQASDPSSGVNVVSMSFGSKEFAGELDYDAAIFQPGVARGLVYVASAGDRGARVSYPAASPYVVGVGGTKLRYDDSTRTRRERSWEHTGGGTSAYELRPTYQDGLTGLPATPYRRTPDVAYSANPGAGCMVIYTNPDGVTRWVSVGGTSVGAPQWAGLVATANASRSTPLSATQFLGTLYRVGSAGASRSLFDIDQGPANSPDAEPGVTAPWPGYDEVTGLGSPNFGYLMRDLSLIPSP